MSECLRFLEDLYGIHARQHCVHYHNVRRVVPDRIQNDLAVFASRHDVKTQRTQFVGTGYAILGAVVSDQDFYFLLSILLPPVFLFYPIILPHSLENCKAETCRKRNYLCKICVKSREEPYRTFRALREWTAPLPNPPVFCPGSAVPPQAKRTVTVPAP